MPLGYIRDSLDMKFLLLYLLSRITGPVSLVTLTELVMCDAGVTYFGFTQALAELVDTGHVTLEHDRYTITEKGKRNGSACESSLPLSVRQKCDQNLGRANAILLRDSQIRAEILPRLDGGVTLRLILDDNKGNLMTLDLYAVSQEHAQVLGDRFREDPEAIYMGILKTLWAESPPEGERNQLP